MRAWSTSAPMCLLLWREPFRLIRGLKVPNSLRWEPDAIRVPSHVLRFLCVSHR
jgi:hypothetical protein